MKQVLLDPACNSADRLRIVTGYASPSMVVRHMGALDKLIDENEIAINLIVGMPALDGLSTASHEGFKKLSSHYKTPPEPRFECKYVVERPAVHAKVYVWLEGEKPVVAFAGSANYTQNAFLGVLRETMTQCDPDVALEYYNSIERHSLDCGDKRVESIIKITDASIIRKIDEDQFRIESEIPGIGNTSSSYSLPHIRLSLLARGGVPGEHSGLNWAHRTKKNHYNRELNQAYIPVPASVYRTDFFPPIGTPFTVFTDDNDSMVLVRAQANGKALHSRPSNSQLGHYFRKRLSLKPGAEVKLSHLQRYGRTDVSFFKTNEDEYFMDFSVSGT